MLAYLTWHKYKWELLNTPIVPYLTSTQLPLEFSMKSASTEKRFMIWEKQTLCRYVQQMRPTIVKYTQIIDDANKISSYQCAFPLSQKPIRTVLTHRWLQPDNDLRLERAHRIAVIGNILRHPYNLSVWFAWSYIVNEAVVLLAESRKGNFYHLSNYGGINDGGNNDARTKSIHDL